MTDPTYTLEDAERQIQRQSCADNRHQPCLEEADFSGEPPVWWCGCQDYLWKRVAREETSG